MPTAAQSSTQRRTHTSSRSEQSRGRYARRPGEIPKQGWRDIALRVVDQIGKDNLPIVAAGVAFYAFLAIFPAILAIVSLYGLVVSPQEVQRQLNDLAGFLPQQSQQLIGQILEQVATRSGQALGWGLALSVVLALWSANAGMNALFTGINIAYDEIDKRNFFIRTGTTLLFTLGGILLTIISLFLVAVVPAALGNVGLPEGVGAAVNVARWPVLALLILVGLAALYRFAPARDQPKWRWVSWGATIATLLWLIGSVVFSLYVSNFGNFDQTYGSVAAIIILLLWFQLTSFVILLGAEINAEMEGQTKVDTTVGEEQPMGQRRAHHADELGKSP